jgi:type VI secretion system secreted protein VgrG
MANYTQDGRPLSVSTPLGKDVMLITSFHGTDSISQLFRYVVEVKTTRQTNVPFEQLIGKPITVKSEVGKKKAFRYFNGICVQIVQGESDADFTAYQMEIVPQFWLLSKKVQSKIFQQITVPDILKKVLAGLDVEYQISGNFEQRDFCVQYRESDFNFASRLMEEEGIYYYFKHSDGKHTMVVANTPQNHADVPGPKNIVYKNVNLEASGDEDSISELSKFQQQASGKFLLWDHTFELPHQHLESTKQLTDSVKVGGVSHKLTAGDATKWEIYDYPGEYAQRFDGITPGGGERPADLSKIPPDGTRTVDLRMQQEASQSVAIRGTSSARQFTSGHKISISTLASDHVTTPIKCEGEYVLTSVTHSATLPATYRSGSDDSEGFRYNNTFQAIPSTLPFRPQRGTIRPVVPGMQTAVVVGPAGEEIFTDKYGRIKVQFHWDRDGKKDANSSCWVRVAHLSAGRGWGMFSLPRIGQEVLIDFLEGDPDQPICVGCVYNPDQMPMYKLPDHKTRSYLRSNSSPGGVGYNAIRLEDKSGQEQMYVHAQKDYDLRVRNDSKERVGNNQHERIGFYLENDHKGDASGETKKGSHFEEIAVNDHRKVHKNFDEQIGGDYKLLVGGGDGEGNMDVHVKKAKHELIDDTLDLHVKNAVKEKFDATYDQKITGQRTETVSSGYDLDVSSSMRMKVGQDVSLTVGSNYQEKTGMKHAVEAGMEIHLKAGMNLVLEAMNITIKGAGGFVTVGPAGVAIQGTMVLINSGGAAGSGGGASPESPKKAQDAADAKDANPTKPTDADLSKTGSKSN